MVTADHRCLPERVDRELDLVAETAGADLDAAGIAVEDKRHRQDRLERITLGTAVRCHVGLSARDSVRKVQDVGDRVRRHAGTIVDHRNRARLDLHHDLGRDARLFTGVKRVVEQLLENHQRPRVRLMPGLRHQLLATAELEQPAGAERRALQSLESPHHESCQIGEPSAGPSGSTGLRR
jgi:hypothetical protein